jgi:protein TonB
MLSSDKDDLWVIITRFRFTRQDTLEAQLRGAQ